MKKLIFWFVLCLGSLSLSAQEDTTYIWPVNTFAIDTMGPDLERGIVMRLWVEETPVCIYAPPKYWNQRFYDQPFNILYLLSGTGDDDRAWVLNGGASDILDEMYQDGEIEQMLVVMPLVDPNMDGEYEKHFYEFMKRIETHVYAGRNKGRRAIAGLSIGAFHAMHISHCYPNMFDYVGLFSGIYTPDKMKIFKKDVKALFPSDESVPEPYRNVEADLARQFLQPPKMYYMAVGSDDFLHRQNLLLHQYLDAHQYRHRFYESDGGHEWKNWKDYLTRFLPKLFRQVE